MVDTEPRTPDPSSVPLGDPREERALPCSARLALTADVLGLLETEEALLDEPHARVWDALSLAALRLARIQANPDATPLREATAYYTLQALLETLHTFAPLSHVRQYTAPEDIDPAFPAN